MRGNQYSWSGPSLASGMRVALAAALAIVFTGCGLVGGGGSEAAAPTAPTETTSAAASNPGEGSTSVDGAAIAPATASEVGFEGVVSQADTAPPESHQLEPVAVGASHWPADVDTAMRETAAHSAATLARFSAPVPEEAAPEPEEQALSETPPASASEGSDPVVAMSDSTAAVDDVSASAPMDVEPGPTDIVRGNEVPVPGDVALAMTPVPINPPAQPAPTVAVLPTAIPAQLAMVAPSPVAAPVTASAPAVPPTAVVPAPTSTPVPAPTTTSAAPIPAAAQPTATAVPAPPTATSPAPTPTPTVVVEEPTPGAGAPPSSVPRDADGRRTNWLNPEVVHEPYVGPYQEMFNLGLTPFSQPPDAAGCAEADHANVLNADINLVAVRDLYSATRSIGRLNVTAVSMTSELGPELAVAQVRASEFCTDQFYANEDPAILLEHIDITSYFTDDTYRTVIRQETETMQVWTTWIGRDNLVFQVSAYILEFEDRAAASTTFEYQLDNWILTLRDAQPELEIFPGDLG